MESYWSWSYVLTLSDNAAVNWYNEIQMKLGTNCQYVMWRSGKVLNFNNLPLSWSSRAGSSFLLNYVQTVSSYIVEEQEMTSSVVPRITYAIWQVSHQVHKWYTDISFHKQRLDKSFCVIDNWPTVISFSILPLVFSAFQSLKVMLGDYFSCCTYQICM